MAKKRIDYSLAKKASGKAALTEQFTKSITSSDSVIRELLISDLTINPYQPRINIDEKNLKKLALSIEKEGLLQPVIVSPNIKDNGYIIIAGHRRVEAHKILNKQKIKAIIIDVVAHEQLAILPIIENLQRDDMNPIENAIAFKRLLNEKVFSTQRELAEKISVSKEWMSKTLSILKLPEDVLKMIKEDQFKDINILSALNKIEKSNIKETYLYIKELPKVEARSYLSSLNKKEILSPINITELLIWRK